MAKQELARSKPKASYRSKSPTALASFRETPDRVFKFKLQIHTYVVLVSAVQLCNRLLHHVRKRQFQRRLRSDG